jgi:hypothetical protein
MKGRHFLALLKRSYGIFFGAGDFFASLTLGWEILYSNSNQMLQTKVIFHIQILSSVARIKFLDFFYVTTYGQ